MRMNPLIVFSSFLVACVALGVLAIALRTPRGAFEDQGRRDEVPDAYREELEQPESKVDFAARKERDVNAATQSGMDKDLESLCKALKSRIAGPNISSDYSIENRVSTYFCFLQGRDVETLAEFGVRHFSDAFDAETKASPRFIATIPSQFELLGTDSSGIEHMLLTFYIRRENKNTKQGQNTKQEYETNTKQGQVQ